MEVIFAAGYYLCSYGICRGFITIEQGLYKKILAVMLFAIVRFITFPNAEFNEQKQHSVAPALFIGAVIGLISGMIGIGGGIILSPILCC